MTEITSRNVKIETSEEVRERDEMQGTRRAAIYSEFLSVGK